MDRLKTILISYLLPIVGVIIVAFGYPHDNPKMYLCSHTYALCTSAMCVPQTGDLNKAICFCDVQEGKSMGSIACERLRPDSDENGIRTIYSTFSLEQFKKGKKGMKCPAGTLWSWCLNKRCTIDPSDPKKALCICDIVRSEEEWMTLGGDCDTATCETGYWSGARMQDLDSGNAFMMKNLNLKASLVKWCQAAAYQ